MKQKKQKGERVWARETRQARARRQRRFACWLRERGIRLRFDDDDPDSRYS